MISVLCPTRKRPKELRRMVESLRATVSKPEAVEVVLYADDDDRASATAVAEIPAGGMDVHCIVGPRIMLSDYWNKCFARCRGDIAMMANDDIVFQTPRWDVAVEAAFAACPDRIVMVHGTDADHRYDKFGAHPFLHRRWVQTIGYFSPPWFCGDYADTWLNEVANMLGRRVALPAVIIDHLHFLFGKAPKDETYRERFERQERENITALWNSLAAARQADARKLCAVMEPPQEFKEISTCQ